jgi:hypothetical protein
MNATGASPHDSGLLGVARARTLRLAGAAGLAAALALALAIQAAPAQEDADIEWIQVYAGKAELTVGQGADLDYGDRTASEVDVEFEDWEGGQFWAPRRGARAAIAGDFTSRSHEDRRTPRRIRVVSGGALAVDPGTILVAVTSDNRYVKAAIDAYEDGKLKFHWITFDKKVIPRAPVAAVSALEAPVLKSPCPDVDFYHVPRDLLLTWAPVRGAVSYVVEIDCRGCCGPRYDWFCGDQEGSKGPLLTLPAATTALPVPWTGEAHQGHWRVRGIDKDGKPGPWSGYFTFLFKR